MEFRDVSFHYPSSDKNVLEHITFQAKRGETVAFIGATGSGKTTLVSLAARFYDATEGTVLVDGVDVRDYTFDALYDRIGYVTQKAILFSGDVRGNVLFGASRGKDSDADVQKALELAQASEFVDRMPGGIHAPIAEGGTNVSVSYTQLDVYKRQTQTCCTSATAARSSTRSAKAITSPSASAFRRRMPGG